MDTKLSREVQVELDACRWTLDLIEDHEREAVRARLEAAGRVLGDDDVWRPPERPRRECQAPISGEIGKPS